VQLATQEDLTQKLTAQLATQETQTQKLTEQLAAQDTQTQKLTEQLAAQEDVVQKLTAEVRAGETQIAQLKAQIAELEGEKAELQTRVEKSDITVQDFQVQIVALQRDIEQKTRKIENVSTERDSERRAKEVVKRILSSNGPVTRESRDSETLGHSHAIRMGSLRSPSPSFSTPSPTTDDDPSSPPSSSSTLKTSGKLRSTNINGIVTTPRGGSEGEGKKGEKDGGHRRSKTNNDVVALVTPGKSLSSKSRSKDDMDIASEADRARVRRLVERWEEMKYLELPTKQ